MFAAPYKVAAIMADLVPIEGMMPKKTKGASESHVAVSKSVMILQAPATWLAGIYVFQVFFSCCIYHRAS